MGTSLLVITMNPFASFGGYLPAVALDWTLALVMAAAAVAREAASGGTVALAAVAPTLLWSEFTPASALLGGLLIGAAAILLLLADGRIAGVSGIVGRLLTPARGDVAWRLCFALGLPLGALLVATARGGLEVELVAGTRGLVAAGLLVGFGTQLGNGCTSGHGVCGLARRSRRSLFATLAFMASGAVTVFVVRHLLGASS